MTPTSGFAPFPFLAEPSSGEGSGTAQDMQLDNCQSIHTTTLSEHTPSALVIPDWQALYLEQGGAQMATPAERSIAGRHRFLSIYSPKGPGWAEGPHSSSVHGLVCCAAGCLPKKFALKT